MRPLAVRGRKPEILDLIARHTMLETPCYFVVVVVLGGSVVALVLVLVLE